MSKKVTFFVFSVVLFATSSVAFAGSSAGYERWLQRTLKVDDALLCKKESNGNYFFVSKNKDRYKVASRVNVTRQGKQPKKFMFSIEAKNEKGHYVTTQGEDHSRDESNEIVLLQNQYYLDSVNFVNLSLYKVNGFNFSYYLGLDEDQNYLAQKLCDIKVVRGKQTSLVNKTSGLKVTFKEARPMRNVGLIYPDKDTTDFLKAVLNSFSILYQESNTTEGLRVQWQSDDEAQVLEIQQRVAQYTYVRDICGGRNLPKPSQPSRPRPSCQ